MTLRDSTSRKLDTCLRRVLGSSSSLKSCLSVSTARYYLPLDKGLVAMLDVVCSSTKKPKKLFIGGYEVEVTGLELRYNKSLEQEFSLTAALSACT